MKDNCFLFIPQLLNSIGKNDIYTLFTNNRNITIKTHIRNFHTPYKHKKG